LVAFGIGLAAATLPASVAVAGDGGRPFATDLTGAQEVNGGDPDGTGTAALRVNVGQRRICYRLSVDGLDPVVGAHIHLGPAGVNGPIVVELAAPVTGSSADCAVVDRDLARDIVRNPENYYVNVHTTAFQNGAVRGQLSR
jgi:hypothetical protein